MSSIGWNWPNLDGLYYYFTVTKIPALLPPASGVYNICRIVPDGFVPLYVGETENLHKRLVLEMSKHEGFSRSLDHGATHIGYHLAEEEDRLRIETELRHSLSPPCNLQPVPFGGIAALLAGRQPPK
ncbi:hypothetical protein KZZ07_16550 [Mameliella sp. CS4]|uniref:hypothetical protein n=1 Tax=Mameliella sp. CS4 TaxID=2862329 RepID=UPI001C5CC873|nr:hypothetical protein [Mameliella sp. CS4]MBW4984155.1 hypothetical protein [Mameliella sp. CS4]